MEKTADYSFFCNKNCEYFPCHKTEQPEQFNCLFCYCPLYALGDRCEGNFKRGLGNLKDCSQCMIPHGKGGYEHIMSHIHLLIEMTAEN